MKITTLLLIILWNVTGYAQVRKVVALGSSTTEGLRATPLDSSWVSRFNHYYKNQLGVLNATYNLGVGGTTQYNAMPSSYSRSGRPLPDPTKNVTKATSLLSDLASPENGVIIVNFPSNGFQNYTIDEIIATLQIIYDSATRTGHKCYITTTQPRTSGVFGTAPIKKKLANIKDAIINRFGVEHTLNFWDGMYNPADTTILPIYSSGDNTHFNNAGHKVLFQRVVAKNIFNLAPLPVNWLSFTCRRGVHSIILDWKTAQETNSKHFEIQRSVDGKNFNALGTRKAAGSSNTIQHYQFTDSEVSDTQTYYYRLRQVDFDGKFKFSSVIAVADNSKKKVKAWPNPVNNDQQFNIIINDISINDYTPIAIKIISPDGLIVFDEQGFSTELTTKAENTIENLTAGIYLIQIFNALHCEYIKVLRY